jgi:hypothetical protein
MELDGVEWGNLDWIGLSLGYSLLENDGGLPGSVKKRKIY